MLSPLPLLFLASALPAQQEAARPGAPGSQVSSPSASESAEQRSPGESLRAFLLGSSGARAAGEGAGGAEGRRRRRALAREIVQVEGPDAAYVLDASALLADSDPVIRELGVEFFARPDLGDLARPERIRALASVVGLRDGSGTSGLALRAVDALGGLGGVDGARALGDAALHHPKLEVRLASAEALADAPGGASEITRLVATLVPGLAEASTGVPVRGLEPEVVAMLLPRYARQLADTSAVTTLDLMPLAIGFRHPIAVVRRASGRAFQNLLDRLAESGAPGRSRAALDLLQGLGIGREVALYQSARLALAAEGDARAALRAAEELVQHCRLQLDAELRLDSFDAQLWTFRAHYLRGLALLALDSVEEADGALGLAASALEVALAERRDLRSEPERLAHVDMLHQRALLEVARTLLPIVDDDRSGPWVNLVLDRARTAHELHLEAQAVYAEIQGDVLTGWDALLSADLSVYQLLFGRRGFDRSGDGALSRARIVELQGKLGRALSTVAPGELPGFQALEPVGPQEVTKRLLDPLIDPARRAFLDRIRAARLAGIDDAIDEANGLVTRAQERAFGIIPEEEINLLERLQRRKFAAQQAAREASRSAGTKWVRDLRIPGSAALWHAQDLKEEGRGVEARAMATRLEADLTQRGISDWWFVLGHERVVRAQLLAGSAYTDEGRGEEAEEVLVRAVTRLEDIERDLTGRGATTADLAGFRALRSTALVSLAVNANVRLLDKDKALGYYERAYELRKDEFMRVLLACYRARSGSEAEARSLLRAIQPGPGTWYNLACTHALLGDTSRALDYLEAELTRNHASVESANHQREWAQGDPDLASLRGEARFKRLVRQR